MSISILNTEDWLGALRRSRGRIPGDYRAMYSSWWGGIVTSPELMILPIDDHIVHRGDGIFEAARIIDGAIFDLDSHLSRLTHSAEKLSLKMPWTLAQIKEICVATVAASGLREAALRLFVGRGPGSFSPNPYDCPEAQLYIVVTDFKAVPEEKYVQGVTAIISKVPQKPAFFSQIKSCNYLPNVLMKKESVDAGVDFSLGCDDLGRVLEGATENLALVSRGRIIVPKFDYTLRGTTLLATLDTLNASPIEGVSGVEFMDVNVAQLKSADEAFMVGTTLEVLPIVEVDGVRIGSGQPGPIARELRRRLRQEMFTNPKRRTVVPV